MSPALLQTVHLAACVQELQGLSERSESEECYFPSKIPSHGV